mgnify:CR=1 FL=1
MLCQSCHKKQATTHIKTIVNGELTQYALCPECAQKLGYGSLFGGFGEGLSSFLGSFFGMPQSAAAERLPEETRCPGCGASFSDIVRTGRVGCAKCYETFYNRLAPSIQRIHGNTTHTGKVPAGASPERRLQNDLEKARRELKEAIEEQRFEEAARLRDRIREMEGEVNHDA